MKKFFNPAALKISISRRGKTVTDIARAINVTPPLVRKFLKGWEEPSQEQITEIAAFLQWPEGFFFNDNLTWGETRWISGHVSKTPIISN